jgi:hypothetical protein
MVLGIALVGAYFLPAIVAAARGHAASGWVFALNLTCGWTWFGWLGALIWAAAGSAAETAPTVEAVIELGDDPDPDDGERRPAPLPKRRVGSRRGRFGSAVSFSAQDNTDLSRKVLQGGKWTSHR